MNTKALSTLSVLAAFSFTAIASAQHADMLLIRDDAGQLLTGQYDFDTNQIVSTDARVYEGEFDIFGTIDEPGFNALSQSSIPAGFQALPGNTPLSFDARSFAVSGTRANLFFWDGSGPVDFTPASNTLTISKAPSVIFSALLDASDTDVAGFDIDTTSADGFLHKHIDFSLSDLSPSSDGFYLWSLSLQVGADTAAPVYYVHAYGIQDEPAHDAAVQWVNDNLVPAPGTLALFLGLPALVTRRRARTPSPARG